MKIALVDDDPRALAQLEQYLTEQLGRETEISHYGSGEALLADWRPGAFELVVLDIYMGGATGMEVARRLRADDGQVRLAFATSSNDFASESYEVGACYYLRKPFRPEGVRAMLERLGLGALGGPPPRRNTAAGRQSGGAAEHPLRRLRRPPGDAALQGWGPYPADLLCCCGAAAVCLSVLLRHLPGRGGKLPRGGWPAGGRVPAEGRHPSAHQPPEVTGGAGGILRLPL